MANSSKSPQPTQAAAQIISPTPFSRLITKMAYEAEIDQSENRGNSATLNTINRIMDDSLTDDEIWNAGDLINIGGRNLVDVEQTVLDFTVKYGARDDIESIFVDSEERKFYLLVRSTIDGIPESDPSEFTRPPLEIGQELIWNTSAPDILPKLYQFRDRGKFPLACVIRALDLGGGKHYLRLKPVPKRAVRTN